MTAISNMPISNFNESRKRGLLLVCVFLFPIIFTSILFTLVALISDIDFKVISHKTQYAAITSPKNQSTVNKKFEISGVLKAPLDGRTYYLVELRNKLYWPKFDLGSKESQWSKQLTHRAAKNKYSSYQVVMADSSLKKTFDDWFKISRKTGKYPGIAKLSIDNIVANIRVKTQ